MHNAPKLTHTHTHTRTGVHLIAVGLGLGCGVGDGGLSCHSDWAVALTLLCCLDQGYHRMLDLFVLLTSTTTHYRDKPLDRKFFWKGRLLLHSDDETKPYVTNWTFVEVWFAHA